MELTKYSRNRLMESLNHSRVCKDFADPMYNYLVHGYEPGGFFSGWYANDATAIIRSHPANTVEALKDLTKWMINVMPHESWGSHDKVRAWLRMEPAQRRKILEECDLIYSEQDEIMMALRNEHSAEPFFLDWPIIPILL